MIGLGFALYLGLVSELVRVRIRVRFRVEGDQTLGPEGQELNRHNESNTQP